MRIYDNITIGSRLDIYITSQHPEMSRSLLQKQIKLGSILVNGTPEKSSYIIEDGDEISGNIVPILHTIATPRDIPINVVYEDEYLAIIDKQAGLTVHPGAGNHNDTLANALVHHFGLNGEHNIRPGIVHRLDRNTSGLMVVAKTDEALAKLSDMIKEREISRQYLTVIKGLITPPAGKIDINLVRSKSDRTKMTIARVGGRSATTHYKTISTHGKFSLLLCRLETGRTHQIRVHLAYRKCPVIGDEVYGQKSPLISRQALHSHILAFTHPFTGVAMSFTSQLSDGTGKDIALILDM
jgi:23S rRNA pseudouridine1911/1915/1917 synthase